MAVGPCSRRVCGSSASLDRPMPKAPAGPLEIAQVRGVITRRDGSMKLPSPLNGRSMARNFTGPAGSRVLCTAAPEVAGASGARPHASEQASTPVGGPKRAGLPAGLTGACAREHDPVLNHGALALGGWNTADRETSQCHRPGPNHGNADPQAMKELRGGDQAARRRDAADPGPSAPRSAKACSEIMWPAKPLARGTHRSMATTTTCLSSSATRATRRRGRSNIIENHFRDDTSDVEQ